MRYVSTRGAWADNPQPFSAILLEGLAPDGGLAVPQKYPRFTAKELDALRARSYRDVAFAVLSRFIADIPAADLKSLIDRTYTKATFSAATPSCRSPSSSPASTCCTRRTGRRSRSRTSRCSSSATCSNTRWRKERSTLNILGATSGDTGSSAEYAMRGKRGINVFMLSPHGRMSPFQQAQMYSLPDPNIHNIAIDGVFDECQDIVKAVSADAEFKARWNIGTVNSINWARVAAQVVYYFTAYLGTAKATGDPIDVAVPSGNFGNILAAHVARSMGLPLRRLIVATNENDVLDEFFRTARYRPRRAGETQATSSPSMDISKASNFERYVFDVVDRDPEVLCALWDRVARRGDFDLAGTPYWDRVVATGFVSGSSTHADRIATIRDAFDRYGIVIDPHTADGLGVGRLHRNPAIPLVCIETALPAKFAATIREALDRDPDRPAAYADLENRTQRCVVLPPDVERVKAYIAEHAGAAG